MFSVYVTDGTVFYTGDNKQTAHNIFCRVVSAYKGDGRTFRMHVFLVKTSGSQLLLSENI